MDRSVSTAADAPDDAPEPRAGAFGNAFVLVGHLTRLTDAALADWGLTTRQWLLLAVLSRGFAGRDASLTEAAASYGSSRQNVKQIALGLERRGFLRLVPDPADGRTTRLHLLPALSELFDTPEGRTRGEALMARVFDGLDAAEVASLHHLLARWITTLTAPAGPPAVITRAPSTSRRKDRTA